MAQLAKIINVLVYTLMLTISFTTSINEDGVPKPAYSVNWFTGVVTEIK